MQDPEDVTQETEESRRSLVTRIAYAVPIVLSLKASPSFAKTGSGGGPSPQRSPRPRRPPRR